MFNFAVMLELQTQFNLVSIVFVFHISTVFYIIFCLIAVSSAAKRTLSVREVWGSIPGPVKSAQCRQRLAIVATFLRSRDAQALSRGDGPRNSLHASAYCGEHNEDLI